MVPPTPFDAIPELPRITVFKIHEVLFGHKCEVRSQGCSWRPFRDDPRSSRVTALQKVEGGVRGIVAGKIIKRVSTRFIKEKGRGTRGRPEKWCKPSDWDEEACEALWQEKSSEE